MIKGFTVRLFPTKQQEELLWKHINVSRFIWNHGLSVQINRYKNGEKHLSKYELRKLFVNLKQQKEYNWLKEISSHTVGNICFDLSEAYDNFFKKISNKPKFKKKNKSKNSFPVRVDSFYAIDNYFNIEKIGKIKYQSNYSIPQDRKIQKFSNPRIKFENNKWLVTFGMESDKQAVELTDKKMGIDLGVKELAVVSFGDEKIVYKNINKTKRIKSLKRKLKHIQRNISRKYETNNKKQVYDKKWHKSNGIIKLEKQTQKIYNKLSNIRKNYIHQTTRELVNKLPRRITVEDLNVAGMMKNKHLSKSIQEQCFYEFLRQVTYKSNFMGIEVVRADRFYPSSKTCSNCGNIKKDLTLKDRIYKCEYCGLEIDRDYNASINLMNYSIV